MNSKKLLSTIAAGVIAASTVIPSTNFAAAYDDELTNAYTWAKENGITNASNIDNAGMMTSMTRIAMAKMLSNFAMDILGKKPDTSRVCNFSDVTAAMDKDYEYGVTNACQLGLMGWDDENNRVASSFNPYGIVDRGNFGTVLSRALWGDMNNGGKPYYKYHLNALKTAGIMTKIETPSQLEMRGYVMLMLQRTAAMVNTEEEATEKCSLAQQFLCIIDDENCPSACEDVVKDKTEKETKKDEEKEEVKSGKLTVNVEKEVDTKDIPTTGTVIVDSIELSSSEEMTVKSITLKLSNYTKADNISSVWFEKDGQTISNEKSTFNNNEVTLTLKKGLTVKKSETIDLVVETKGAETNAVIGFEVVKVESTAESVKIKNAMTTSCKTIPYKTAEITVTPKGSGASYEKNNESHEFGQFRVKNEGGKNGKTVNLSSITFTVAGENVDNLTDFEIKDNDGKVVSTSYVVNKDKVTISLKDSIESQKNKNYYLMAKVDEVRSAEDSYTFKLDEAGDFVAYEEGTSARATANTFELKTYKVIGGDFTLASTQTLKSVQGNWGKEVMVAEGTFDVIEAIVLKKENQGYTKGKTSALKITGKNFSGLNMLTINIDGQNYDAVIDSDYESAYVTDDINIPEGTSKIKVYAELLTTKPTGFAGNITFDNITTDSFTHTGKYEANSEKEFSVAAKMVGTLTMANVEIDGGQVILEKNTTTNLVLNQTKVNGNVFEGTIKNEGSFDLKIDSISLTGKVNFIGSYTKADAGNDNIAIALSADGKAGRTSDKKITIKDEDSYVKTFTFDSPVKIKAGDSVKVSLDVTSAAITMTGANKDEDYMKSMDFQVSVKVIDDENGTEIETPSNTITATVDVKSVKIEKGTSTNKSSIILHKTSKQLIGQGEIQIKNGDAQLKNIQAVITGGNTNKDLEKVTSVLVEIDGVNNGTKTYSIVNNASDPTTFKNSGISQTISEGYHKVRLYASFGDFEKSAGSIYVSGITLGFDEGQGVIGITTEKSIYPAKLNVARSNALNENKLVLKLTNEGQDTVYVKTISGDNLTDTNITVDGVEYTANTAKVENLVAISAGASIEVNVTVKSKPATEVKAFIKAIEYTLDPTDSTKLIVDSTNFSELDWANFYAVF